RECGKLVAVRAEGKSGEFGDLFGRTLGELGMRIETGSYSGSADCQIVKTLKGLLQALDVALQQAGPAAEFLADGQRNSVLQMGAANFNDIVKFLRLGSDGILNALARGNQCVPHSPRRRNVHRCGEGIVR